MNRKTYCALFLGAALVASGCQQNKGAAGASASPSASPAGMSDDDKAIYALGAAMGQQATDTVAPLMLTPAEVETFKKGLSASLAGQTPEYSLEQYGSKLQSRAQANAPKLLAAEKQKGSEFAPRRRSRAVRRRPRAASSTRRSRRAAAPPRRRRTWSRCTTTAR